MYIKWNGCKDVQEVQVFYWTDLSGVYCFISNEFAWVWAAIVSLGYLKPVVCWAGLATAVL